MSYHVGVGLPDGRLALADYRLPVTAPMQRINRALAGQETPDPADYAAVAAWLDAHPEQCCTQAGVRDGCHRAVTGS